MRTMRNAIGWCFTQTPTCFCLGFAHPSFVAAIHHGGVRRLEAPPGAGGLLVCGTLRARARGDFWRGALVSLVLAMIVPAFCLAADTGKPCVAVFPLSGDATPELRERAAFALRAKLDRTGKFEVVDGAKMNEVVGDQPVTLASTPEKLKELSKLVDAQIILWGEVAGGVLHVKVLDMRSADAREQELTKPVKEPTDLRFAVEEALQTIQGVAAFEHPVEQAVWDDPAALQLWEKNPNLLINGDFASAGKWTGIYQAEFYPIAIQQTLPVQDKVAIVREEQKNALMLNLSKGCAENNGLAALSDSFRIEPNTRYRISFRYWSDGPMLHVFVKGYMMYPNVKGVLVEREIYRRQVPPTGATRGKWVTLVDDLNPQHVSLPVQTLKVDLYAYLTPGMVKFQDVVVKAVGKQTRQAKDAAIKPSATRPVGKN